ncbi:cytochrome P450 [Actinomadura rubrobrunea]|uniref:Cytochrome P450 n=1 Tax=Actinomadura rubrobrunea TaxID=115335 RepID=A0A9W6UUZ6_9ACTN|nr:cytochrome P450 [Actinomadura rubrobrunea]GLW65161.1 cytochrome P450 [Actinomadura rubrobrunea]
MTDAAVSQTATAPDGPPPAVGDGRATLAWLTAKRDAAPLWHDETTGSFHVFGHPEMIEILSDPATFSSDFSAMAPPPDPDVPNFMEASLTVTDPPRHGQLRKLVSQAFTPRMVDRLRTRISEVTGELLDAVGDRDRFDLVGDVAYPLPVIVIAEMLGIPAADRDLFRHWAELLLSNSENTQVGTLGEAGYTGDRAEQLRRMSDYLLEHARERRKQPRDDLIGRLVAAEVDGERLTDQQIINFSAFLLLAGHLTTTLLLGNAMLAFGEHPDQVTAVRDDPGLIPAAIEEVLRYRPPVVFLYRLTKQPATIGGVEIPAGRIVVCWIMSANRDERVFTAAERFDVGRQPNPHLTFSHGIHFCLGAPLARAESAIALRALLDRFADIRCGTPVYHQKPDIFGVRELPLDVRRA